MDVTLIISTYNRYNFLKRALKSVYAQSYQPKEVIVVDDGSNDETKQITKEYPKIIYIYQKNSGVSSARNTGIKASTCRWITFLDSDDEWHKDKLKKQVEFHEKNPDIFVSYTDEKWVKDGKVVNVPKKFCKYGGDIFDKCLSHCIIAPSSVMIKKDVFDDVGVFDENLEVCEDYDLWLRIAIRYKIGLINEKLIIKYAGHNDQLSFKYWGMDRFRVKALKKLLDTPKKEQIRQELIKKYTLLIKGAKKYDKIQDILFYEEKLKNL